MRIHTIIHAPFEMPGAIEDWIIQNGHHLTSTHTYKGEKLPSVAEIDFLIIMGGPQSPTEFDKYPYLRDEVALAKQAIDQNKAVLGVCLGAQIIGESLGAKTERSPNKEVGIFPVQLTNEGEQDPIFKQFPKQFDVMHWHNDMPGISSGAVLLAKSEGCPRQAVRYSDRVYGLQFHMEMTHELVKGMIEHCPDDLKSSKYTQEAKTILATDFAPINKKIHMILDHLAEVISEDLVIPS